MKIGFKGGILSYRVGLKGLSWVARISVNLCEMADRQTVTGLSLSCWQHFSAKFKNLHAFVTDAVHFRLLSKVSK